MFLGNKVVGSGSAPGPPSWPLLRRRKGVEKMKKWDTGRKNEEKSEKFAWCTLKKQRGTAVASVFFQIAVFQRSSITSSHNTSKNRPIRKSIEKQMENNGFWATKAMKRRSRLLKRTTILSKNSLPLQWGAVFQKQHFYVSIVRKAQNSAGAQPAAVFRRSKGWKNVPKIQTFVVER